MKRIRVISDSNLPTEDNSVKVFLLYKVFSPALCRLRSPDTELFDSLLKFYRFSEK